MHSPELLKRNLNENGYVLIKNAFTTDEIDQMRAGVQSALSVRLKHGQGVIEEKTAREGVFYSLPELLSVQELAEFNHVVLEPRLTKLISQLLDGPICYFGDSVAQVGTGTRGFHKDNVDRNDQSGPDWQSNYDVVRLGIYTQDTHSYSGGMQLRHRSHLWANRFKGRPLNMRLKKGDILIWKLTTTHSGNTLLPRLFPWFSYLLPRLTTYLPKWLFRPYASQRVALFMSFGALKSEHTKNYHRYLEQRSDTIKFTPTEDAQKLAKNQNVTLLALKA